LRAAAIRFPERPANLDTALDFAQDDVTGQHGADLGFHADGLVRHVRIAGAKNTVGIHIDIDFLLHRLLDVYFGQHAEAVVGQRGAGSAIDFFEVGAVDNAIYGVTHGLNPLRRCN
jgi:hypothetical protein